MNAKQVLIVKCEESQAPPPLSVSPPKDKRSSPQGKHRSSARQVEQRRRNYKELAKEKAETTHLTWRRARHNRMHNVIEREVSEETNFSIKALRLTLRLYGFCDACEKRATRSRRTTYCGARPTGDREVGAYES